MAARVGHGGAMFAKHLPEPLRTWWVRLKEFEATVGVLLFIGAIVTTVGTWLFSGTEGVVFPL